MSVVILKDEHKTMIVTVDKRYVINIPETKELYHKEIYPMTHELLGNIGFLCNRRKIGSKGVTISQLPQ